jgi:hypothetical protein
MQPRWREEDPWDRDPLRVRRLNPASDDASIKNSLSVLGCFSPGQTVTLPEIGRWLNLSPEIVGALTKNLVSLLIVTEPHEDFARLNNRRRNAHE